MKKYFLDCGSNLGQGYEYFRNKYGNEYFYMLFEPNVNCYNKLIEKYAKTENIKIHNTAVYIDNTPKFFTFVTDYCVGGSIISGHNSALPANKRITQVECVDIRQVLDELLVVPCEIIMKLDVESSEYDILESLIDGNYISRIEKIYCEFHTQYMNPVDRKIFVPREQNILNYMKTNNIKFELWH